MTVSREEVRRLASRGILQKSDDGRFDTDRSRWSYIEFLRAQSHRGEALNEARLKLLELKTKKMRGLMLDLRPGLDYFTEMFLTPLLADLDGLPSRFCGKDVPERKRLKAMVDQIRNDACRRCDVEAARLAAASDDDQGEAA